MIAFAALSKPRPGTVFELDGLVPNPVRHEARLTPSEERAARDVVCVQATFETIACRLAWRAPARRWRS